MVQVFDMGNGWVVGLHDGRMPLYVGRDGYWTRATKHATPFTSYKQATSVRLQLEAELNG